MGVSLADIYVQIDANTTGLRDGLTKGMAYVDKFVKDANQRLANFSFDSVEKELIRGMNLFRNFGKVINKGLKRDLGSARETVASFAKDASASMGKVGKAFATSGKGVTGAVALRARDVGFGRLRAPMGGIGQGLLGGQAQRLITGPKPLRVEVVGWKLGKGTSGFQTGLGGMRGLISGGPMGLLPFNRGLPSFGVSGRMPSRVPTRQPRREGAQGLYRAEEAVGRMASVSSRAFLGLAGAVTVSGKAFGDFQKEMMYVSTMLKDQEMNYMPAYTEAVRNLSTAYGESTKTVSMGLYNILSAAIPAADAITIMNASIKASIGGMTDSNTAAKAITLVMNSYQMTAKDATKITDIMFMTVKRGVITYEELAQSLGRIAAMAAVSGIKFEELNAVIATLTRAGLSGAETMVTISAILRSFLLPQKNSIEAAKKYNLVLSTQVLREKGLVGVLEQVRRAKEEDLAVMFPRIRAIRGVAAALQNMKGIEEDIILMDTAAGQSQIAFEKMATGIVFSFNLLKEQGADALRELGKVLLDTGKEGETAFAWLTQLVKEWKLKLRAMTEEEKESLQRWTKLTIAGTAFAYAISKMVESIASLTIAVIGLKLGWKFLTATAFRVGLFKLTGFVAVLVTWFEVLTYSLKLVTTRVLDIAYAGDTLSDSFNNLMNRPIGKFLGFILSIAEKLPGALGAAAKGIHNLGGATEEGASWGSYKPKSNKGTLAERIANYATEGMTGRDYKTKAKEKEKYTRKLIESAEEELLSEEEIVRAVRLRFDVTQGGYERTLNYVKAIREEMEKEPKSKPAEAAAEEEYTPFSIARTDRTKAIIRLADRMIEEFGITKERIKEGSVFGYKDLIWIKEHWEGATWRNIIGAVKNISDRFTDAIVPPEVKKSEWEKFVDDLRDVLKMTPEAIMDVTKLTMEQLLYAIRMTEKSGADVIKAYGDLRGKVSRELWKPERVKQFESKKRTEQMKGMWQDIMGPENIRAGKFDTEAFAYIAEKAGGTAREMGDATIEAAKEMRSTMLDKIWEKRGADSMEMLTTAGIGGRGVDFGALSAARQYEPSKEQDEADWRKEMLTMLSNKGPLYEQLRTLIEEAKKWGVTYEED